MDCDTTQEHSGNNYSPESTSANASKFSMLHNSAYGLVLKDEIDLDYDTKDQMNNMNGNMMQPNQGYGYDVNDSLMNDGSVDTLQLTATLAFSSPAEHALLDSLTDAVDLSSFLQRLPNDDQASSHGNDLEIASTPSLTPDSVSVHPNDNNCLDTFPDIVLQRGYDRPQFALNAGQNGNHNRYHDSHPPPYQQNRDMNAQLFHQLHHGVAAAVAGGHSQPMANGHNGYVPHMDQLSISNDMDSHSNMSLPSPGSVEAPDAKIIQSVSAKPMNQLVAGETKRRVSIIIGWLRGMAAADISARASFPNQKFCVLFRVYFDFCTVHHCFVCNLRTFSNPHYPFIPNTRLFLIHTNSITRTTTTIKQKENRSERAKTEIRIQSFCATPCL